MRQVKPEQHSRLYFLQERRAICAIHLYASLFWTSLLESSDLDLPFWLSVDYFLVLRFRLTHPPSQSHFHFQTNFPGETSDLLQSQCAYLSAETKKVQFLAICAHYSTFLKGGSLHAANR